MLGLLLACEAYSLTPPDSTGNGVGIPHSLNALSYQAPVRYPPSIHEREER